MLNAFVAVDSDPGAGTLPEVFLRFSSRFDGAVHSSWCGAPERAGALEEGLGADAPAPRWSAPADHQGEAERSRWVRTCVAFIGHFTPPGYLVIWVSPSEVTEPAALQLWWQRTIVEAPTHRHLIATCIRTHAVSCEHGESS
jgi:hypothetical protein